jgi:hypothetical protein
VSRIARWSLVVVATIGVLCAACAPPGPGGGGDTAPPVLSLPEDVAGEGSATDGGGYVGWQATAVDAVDGDVPVDCSPAPGLFPIGVTVVTCTATDAAGNAASGTFTVTVVQRDEDPPVLNLPTGITEAANTGAGAEVTWIATAHDAVDGEVAVACDPSPGTFPVGNTDVTCSATDAAGNTETASFTVTVEDVAAPILNLPAGIVTPATTPTGSDVDWTATAEDEVDGSVPVTCSSAPGAFPIGTTTVTCTATDAAGNTSSGSFEVTVGFVDFSPPILNLPADFTLPAEDASGSDVFWSAAAYDLVDGFVEVKCMPGIGRLPLGVATVHCSATDSAGNVAAGSFVVTVVDVAPPVLNLPTEVFAAAEDASGADVTWEGFAQDNVDGPVAVECATESAVVHPGARFGVGTHQVTCGAYDTAGNHVAGSFVITVADTTAPMLNLPTGITETATDPSGPPPTWTATAFDNVDGPVEVYCDPPPGTQFDIGDTVVSCSAEDATGNVANASFVVTMEPPFSAALLALGGDLPLSLNGASRLIVDGDAYVNSPSAPDPEAVRFYGTSPELNIAGDFSVQTGGTCSGCAIYANKLPSTHQSRIPDPLRFLPEPDASGLPIRNDCPVQTVDGSDRRVCQPGIYPSQFPPSGGPAGVKDYLLEPGVYLLHDGLRMVGGSLQGNEVLLYNASGGVDISYGFVDLSPPTVGPYTGVLLFQARSNASEVYVRGSSDVASLTGTLYAPTSVGVELGAAASDLRIGRVIAESIQTSGTGTVIIGPYSGPSNTETTTTTAVTTTTSLLPSVVQAGWEHFSATVDGGYWRAEATARVTAQNGTPVGNAEVTVRVEYERDDSTAILDAELVGRTTETGAVTFFSSLYRRVGGFAVTRARFTILNVSGDDIWDSGPTTVVVERP